MTMKNWKTILSMCVAIVAISSCSEDDYKVYDTTQTDNVFFSYTNQKNETDSVISYNFGFDPAEEHIVEIPFTLMGMPSAKDRTVGLQAVADSTEMVEGTHYVIDRAVLRAGRVEDTIRIKLLRPEDETFRKQAMRLWLEIVPSADLTATGQKDFVVYGSDIRVESRPDWWSTFNNLPEYSFENAQLFFKYFYELAPKGNKDIFDEMIKRYGDYFVNAQSMQGPFAMYWNFLANYVLIPMYQDHKDDIVWPNGAPGVN